MVGGNQLMACQVPAGSSPHTRTFGPEPASGTRRRSSPGLHPEPSSERREASGESCQQSGPVNHRITSRSGCKWKTISPRSHSPQHSPISHPSPTLLPPSSRHGSIAWRHPPIHATPWLGSLSSAPAWSGNPQPFDRSFSHPEPPSLDRSIARSPDGGGGGGWDPPGETPSKMSRARAHGEL
jgi:hypothetical protein